MSSINKKTDKKLAQQTKERYAQALIWNRKYIEAATLIKTLAEKHPNKNWVLSLRATLNIYKSNINRF